MTDGSISARGRAVRLAVVGAAMFVAAVVLLALTPAFLVGPGPVVSVVDDLLVDGSPAADVIDGDFLFTTIEAQPVRAIRIFGAALDPERQLVARDAVVPSGLDDEAFLAEQQTAFDASVDDAAAAAAQVLGGEAPSAELDGGVVGGPSAGLLIALAIHDAASPIDVAAGRAISGTGEVEADGSVTSVGSIGFKVRGAAGEGAALFLVPSAQLEQAREALPEGSGMQVLAVDSLAQAVEVLTGG